MRDSVKRETDIKNKKKKKKQKKKIDRKADVGKKKQFQSIGKTHGYRQSWRNKEGEVGERERAGSEHRAKTGKLNKLQSKRRAHTSVKTTTTASVIEMER